MKTPKAQVDNTAAYMNKGIRNNAAQNAPKGTGFAESEVKPSGHIGLGLSQHKKPMNEHGTRHHGPNEHMDPSHAVFDKLGKF